MVEPEGPFLPVQNEDGTLVFERGGANLLKFLVANAGTLTRLGYELELVATNSLNRMSIEMYGREIFRCEITNLTFNMFCEDDVVCQRAVAAVEEAKERMKDVENIPKLGEMLTNNRGSKGKSTKDLLSSDTQLIFEIGKLKKNQTTST